MVQLLLFSGHGLLRCLKRSGRGLVGCGSVVLVSWCRKKSGEEG